MANCVTLYSRLVVQIEELIIDKKKVRKVWQTANQICFSPHRLSCASMDSRG
jgi:hypothetical protein